MSYQKYDSSLRTLYGFGASRITRGDMSIICRVFEHYKIGESNSTWKLEREALRIEVSAAEKDNRSYVFNLLKLSRRRFLLHNQRIWLVNEDGRWGAVWHR